MNISYVRRRLFDGLSVAAVLVSVAGCGLDKQSAPALAGPSEFGLAISLTATPDQLSRDGRSISTVRVVARDAGGRPASGQRFTLQATAGRLSAGEVTTNSAGEAQLELIAPPVDQDVSILTVSATPIGTDFGNSHARRVTIGMYGAAVPRADFTSSPSAPRQFDLVSFDASASSLDGGTCSSSCTFAWDFGDATSAAGAVVGHRFQAQGSFNVILTATGPTGLSASKMHSVTVGASAPLTVEITWSPTNPRRGDTVFFDGRSSTTPDGAVIVDYQWDFGNGQTSSGVSTTAVYADARIYTVRLTIRDSLGRTQTKTAPITVTLPTGS